MIAHYSRHQRHQCSQQISPALHPRQQRTRLLRRLSMVESDNQRQRKQRADTQSQQQRGQPGLRTTQLYKSLLVTSGAMTHRLNRLEQVGLISRVADPQDKRSTLVALTAAGQEKIEQALQVHTQTQNALLSALEPAQRQQLATLLSQLLNASEPDT